jgi:hypothetical protein
MYRFIVKFSSAKAQTNAVNEIIELNPGEVEHVAGRPEVTNDPGQ